MEMILFDSYRSFHKQYTNFTIRRFLGLPVFAIILITIAFASMTTSIFLIFAKGSEVLQFFSVCAEGVTVVLLYFYAEWYQIKTVDRRLIAYKSFCKDLYDWLVSIDYNVSQHSVMDLKIRIEKQIMKKEDIRNKYHNTLKHIFDVIFVPILLAIFAKLIQNETEIAVLFVSAFKIFACVFSIGMMAYIPYRILNFKNKRKLEQLKCFASDLQGILDTQFEENLIITKNAATE